MYGEFQLLCPLTENYLKYWRVEVFEMFKEQESLNFCVCLNPITIKRLENVVLGKAFA